MSEDMREKIKALEAALDQAYDWYKVAATIRDRTEIRITERIAAERIKCLEARLAELLTDEEVM